MEPLNFMLVSGGSAIAQIVFCILILFAGFVSGTFLYMLIGRKPRETKERVRGEYTGCLTEKFLSELERMLKRDPKRAEILVYLTIYKLEWAYSMHFSESPDGTRHDEMLDRLSEEWDYARAYLILQTKQFGVEFDYMRDNTVVSYYSPSYCKWDKFWREYIDSLDTNTWKAFEYAIFNGGDITPYLPKKAWNEEWCMYMLTNRGNWHSLYSGCLFIKLIHLDILKEKCKL